MPRRKGTKRGSQGLDLEEKQRINADYSVAANPLHGMPLGSTGAAFFKQQIEHWREFGVRKKLGAAYARTELNEWVALSLELLVSARGSLADVLGALSRLLTKTLRKYPQTLRKYPPTLRKYPRKYPRTQRKCLKSLPRAWRLLA